jgi:alkaline phosphatase
MRFPFPIKARHFLFFSDLCRIKPPMDLFNFRNLFIGLISMVVSYLLVPASTLADVQNLPSLEYPTTQTTINAANYGGTVQCPGDLDDDSVPDPWLDPPDNTVPNPDFDPNVRCMHLTAGDGFVTMADGRVQYTFGFSDVTGTPKSQVMDAGTLAAAFPAPTITVDEGNDFYLNLTNVGMEVRDDLLDPHTVHWLGFPQAAPIFAGVPDSSISINAGATLTYYYKVPGPGTYMYHCRVEATEHMQMGMSGNLYVKPEQDGTLFTFQGRDYTQFAYNDGDGSTGYDVDFPIQIGSFDGEFHDASETVAPLPFAEMKDTYFMLNGRGYPDTVNPDPLPVPGESITGVFPTTQSQPMHSLIEATQGERILLRLSNLSISKFNTLISPSIPMQVVGKDARLLRSTSGENLYYKTNSVTLGGGMAADVILDTAGVAPGTYFLYSADMNYLSNNEEDFGGVMTEIVIHPSAIVGVAKNIILFIGDGMGFEQIKAAGMYAAGMAGSLSFENFSYSGSVNTSNAEGGVTDSAAAATAMATGEKVSNSVISVALPGDGTPLETVLEQFKASGQSTGLVTTSFVTHATPAAFGAHEPSRFNYSNITADYLNDSSPNVLFGGAVYITQEAAAGAGYTVVTDFDGLQALDTESETMVSGQFGIGNMPFEFDGLGGLPHLSEMTLAALQILDNDPDGLFLMVEGGRIDDACHANDIERAIWETIEFSNAVAVAVEWSNSHPDTLLIVTSDHETGGLQVLANNGAGNLPTVTWGTTGHTSTPVPVFGWGIGAESVFGTIENTEIFHIMINSSASSGIAIPVAGGP